MAVSNTSICNQALARVGAKRINDYSDNTDTKPEAIHCRLFFEPTRDALLMSNWWRFARRRATLTANTTDPDFEYTYAYDLPSDCLRMISVYEDNNTGKDISRYTYYLEKNQILSDEDEMEMRYIKRVTDPSEFSPMFVEALALQLAMKLVMPLTQDKALRRDIHEELWGRGGMMARVRLMDKQERNSVGRGDMNLWNDARLVGAGDPAKSYS